MVCTQLGLCIHTHWITYKLDIKNKRTKRFWESGERRVVMAVVTPVSLLATTACEHMNHKLSLKYEKSSLKSVSMNLTCNVALSSLSFRKKWSSVVSTFAISCCNSDTATWTSCGVRWNTEDIHKRETEKRIRHHHMTIAKETRIHMQLLDLVLVSTVRTVCTTNQYGHSRRDPQERDLWVEQNHIGSRICWKRGITKQHCTRSIEKSQYKQPNLGILYSVAVALFLMDYA